MNKKYNFGNVTVFFNFESNEKRFCTMQIYINNICIYNEFISIISKNMLQNILLYIEPFQYQCKDVTIKNELKNLINTLQAKIYRIACKNQ